VGDKRGQSQKSTAAAAPKPVDPGTVSRIRQDLQKLQGQLDEVNQKLVSFKNFQEGETVTTGDDENATGYKRTPVNQQMAALQQKKKKLEDQIDALVDEARKKGIEPGQLR
jgi:predicted  nucleic acid-binding Zn-ribbon protein